MPQSLVKNYVHLIFSTKHREHSLHEAIQPELFRYIAGICKHSDCCPVQIGGYTNHVHALFLLSKKMTLIKIVEEIKSHSSIWIKKQSETYQNFYWQNGYGAFSINPSEVDVVIDYIKNQKEHHRCKTFEEEYRAFLKNIALNTKRDTRGIKFFRPFRTCVSPCVVLPGLAGRANYYAALRLWMAE